MLISPVCNLWVVRSNLEDLRRHEVLLLPYLPEMKWESRDPVLGEIETGDWK